MRQASKPKNSLNNEIRLFSFFYNGKVNNIAFISPNPMQSAKNYEKKLKDESIQVGGYEAGLSFHSEKVLEGWGQMMGVKNIIIIRE